VYKYNIGFYSYSNTVKQKGKENREWCHESLIMDEFCSKLWVECDCSVKFGIERAFAISIQIQNRRKELLIGSCWLWRRQHRWTRSDVLALRSMLRRWRSFNAHFVIWFGPLAAVVLPLIAAPLPFRFIAILDRLTRNDPKRLKSMTNQSCRINLMIFSTHVVEFWFDS